MSDAYIAVPALIALLVLVLAIRAARRSGDPGDERFRALAENASVAIVIIDEASTITFANAATERIFGWEAAELLGRSLTMLMPAELRERHRAAIAHYLATSERHIRWEGVELPGATRDGEVVPLEISFGEFTREGGRRYFTGILRDISDRKRVEEERNLLLERERAARTEAERGRLELERVMESRMRLMRGFTHDVKNPLGVADGHLELIERGTMDLVTSRQLQSISTARRSIRSAIDLIDHLVEFGRAETGQLEVTSQLVDVRRIAHEAVEDHRAQANAAGLSLSLRVAGEPPQIESDPGRIHQILGNLLSNAIKYTDRGSISVLVEPRRDGKAPRSGRWIALDVRDTGRGIPEETQRLVFEEFARLDPHAGPGDGLGLAISRRVARLLEGDITLESRAGEGSTFTLWLPAARVGEASEPCSPGSREGTVSRRQG